MKQVADELLKDAFDLHVHGYPEVHRTLGMALDDVEQAQYAQTKEMAGYVLKSHIWPTMDRAYHIDRLVSGIDVAPSIVLNHIVGGVDPSVVEAAIVQGARAIFFPTWTSANDIKNGGFSRLIRRELPSLASLMDHGLTVIDGDGALTVNARDVLRVAKEHEVLVSTGHLSGREAVALSREADRIDFRRLIFSHPDSRSVGASDDEIVEAAQLGTFIEWTFIGMLPVSQRIKPQTVVDWIERLGVDRCVMTTDTFGPGCLPEPDQLKLYISVMLECGVSPEDIKSMVSVTPRRLMAGTGVHEN